MLSSYTQCGGKSFVIWLLIKDFNCERRIPLGAITVLGWNGQMRSSEPPLKSLFLKSNREVLVHEIELRAGCSFFFFFNVKMLSETKFILLWSEDVTQFVVLLKMYIFNNWHSQSGLLLSSEIKLTTSHVRLCVEYQCCASTAEPGHL